MTSIVQWDIWKHVVAGFPFYIERYNLKIGYDFKCHVRCEMKKNLTFLVIEKIKRAIVSSGLLLDFSLVTKISKFCHVN